MDGTQVNGILPFCVKLHLREHTTVTYSLTKWAAHLYLLLQGVIKVLAIEQYVSTGCTLFLSKLKKCVSIIEAVHLQAAIIR